MDWSKVKEWLVTKSVAGVPNWVWVVGGVVVLALIV